jgi:hypothetical protein
MGPDEGERRYRREVEKMMEKFSETLAKIDWTYVECPHCGRVTRVEWYRRPNRMPPQTFFCRECKRKTDWDDLFFLGDTSDPQVPRYQ